MASSSSSSLVVSQVKHDVFLSFRGEDTRHKFISHLYAALYRRNIDTFLDDKLIERGDTMSPTLLAAIEGSKISVIIFSEKYANSTWCLDELDKIIECKNTNAKGHIVIPVFYDIDPSHVRKQTGPYEDAFNDHEKNNQLKVQKWRRALREASNIAGWDSRNTRFESEFVFVENIVEDVLQKLNHIFNPQVSSELVGIQKHIAHVESLLCVASMSVHIIGIWGMGGMVGMHDSIQEMGWHIVRQESMKEPKKRSRLWEPEEIYLALKRKKGMNYSTECILLDMSKIKDVEIGPKAFIPMHKLRLLKFFLPDYYKRCNVHIPKGLDGLPDELCYFRWDCFPLKALPSSFHAEMLVELDIKESLVEKLWEGEQDLSNLKSLFLSGCKHLIQLPNLSKAKNLEEIHLGYCIRLRDVPSYIFSLDRLIALNLSGCRVLQRIRSNRSSSLQWLNLSGCSLLSEFSVTSDKLEYLSLDGTALEELPLSVGGAKNLSFLSLAGCKIFENLPNNFYNIGLDACVKIANCPKLGKLPSVFETSSSITSLYLDGCSNLSELPENLSLLSALNELSLRGSSIETLPASIGLLSHLTSLNVSHCKRLQSLPELPLLLRELDASGCVSLRRAQCIGNSLDRRYYEFFARRSEDVGLSLRHRDYSQRFEFYGCERLSHYDQEILMDEAVNRIKTAACISLMLRASAKSDPYNQFRQFFKDTDARSFEYSCRRLCTSLERHKFPSWFWLRRVESSSVNVKLNGDCCSHCRDHPYAFGIYLSKKEENIDLGFDGIYRICMRQWDEAPIRSYWKLGCNDVRLSLPGSCVPLWFRCRSTKTANITINLPPHCNFFALVFCIVVSNCLPNAMWSLQNVKCDCYLETEGRRSQSYRSAYSCDSEMDLISDTIFVWYDAYTSDRISDAIEESRGNDQCTAYSPKLSFRFSLTQEALTYQIKECGVKVGVRSGRIQAS